jgi:hypothetical protein
MEERRNDKSPIPDSQVQVINEHQQHGLEILGKFGWKLVCIRRQDDINPSVILKNSEDGVLGTLEADGVLRLNSKLAIRKNRGFEFKTVLSSFGNLFARMR